MGRFRAGDIVASRALNLLEDRDLGHDSSHLRIAVAVLERERDEARKLLKDAADACETGWLPDGDSIGQNIPTVMFGEALRGALGEA